MEKYGNSDEKILDESINRKTRDKDFIDKRYA